MFVYCATGLGSQSALYLRFSFLKVFTVELLTSKELG